MTGIFSTIDWLPFMAGMAAKATLVLALAALVSALLWRSSAAVRHLVWCVGVIGVLALPVLSVLLPAWELPLLPAREAPAAPAPTALNADLHKLTPAPETADVPAAAMDATEAPSASSTAGAWLPRAAALLVLGGAAAGLLWLALGFWGVSRLGRRSQVVGDAEWLRSAHEAAEQLGLRRPVLLLRSPGSVMPATGGILWPVIVVPEAADAWSGDRRRAVLAHELAHVKRHDCLTQALAQVACALFWWHPAVWYAARRLRVERERACDDLVLRAGTRASEYAAHLLEIARAHKSMRMATPALVSMARPSHLESRLLWVLDGARARGVPSPRATVLAVVMGLLAVGSLSAMRPTPARAAGGNAAPPIPGAATFLPGADAPAAADAPEAADTLVDADMEIDAEAAGDPHALYADTPALQEGVLERARDRAKDAATDRALDEPRDRIRDAARDGGRRAAAARAGAAGDTFPDVDDLIEMRAVGVTPAYIAELRAAGYDGLTVKQLVDLRATGVTGAFATAMNGLGMGRLSVGQLVDFGALGVTPAFVAELRRLGYDRLTPREVTDMRAVGVNGAYIQGMADVGYARIPANDLIDLRAVGVTPAYVAELARHGLRNVRLGTLENLKAVGVTGEYVAEMRSMGLGELNAAALSELRALRVTPAYIRELAGVGLTGLSVTQLTELRVHRVTAAYVRELQAAGLAPMTADQLVRLRVSGVDRELINARKRQ